MYTTNLYNKVLVEPASIGANTLYIVSGYATAAMTFHHLEELYTNDYTISINLIVGMTPQDGLSYTNHKGFTKLSLEDFPDNFNCFYIFNGPPVHSKVYAWFKNDSPITGFVGSANYSQRAFSVNQREVLVENDPLKGKSYFESLLEDAKICTSHDMEELVQTKRKRYQDRKAKQLELVEEQSELLPEIRGLEAVKVSFLARTGNLPQRSGLNWGQRPEEGREPNQAYIRLSSKIYNSDFFPERATHFTVMTDDGEILICTRAQDNGKAIQTPHNNSILGKYFRKRLGISLGGPVLKSDLEKYGRSDIIFYKLDDETFYMDFSVKNEKR